MKTVSVSKLRQKLPHYLAMASRGETVQITSRRRTIARIVPAPVSADDSAAARNRLRNSVVRFTDPFEPVFDPREWDVNG